MRNFIDLPTRQELMIITSNCSGSLLAGATENVKGGVQGDVVWYWSDTEHPDGRGYYYCMDANSQTLHFASETQKFNVVTVRRVIV